MNTDSITDDAVLDCHACIYAHALPHPFDDWIWCDRPDGASVLNLARSAECRWGRGGKARQVSRKVEGKPAKAGDDLTCSPGMVRD